MSGSKQKKSRRLTNLVPNKYSLQQRRSAAAEEGLKLEGEKFSSYWGSALCQLMP
jgi:hypothetical protein